MSLKLKVMRESWWYKYWEVADGDWFSYEHVTVLVVAHLTVTHHLVSILA